MQVGKGRVKGYLLAGFHPVSNDTFLPLICPLLPPVPFGLLQRFCRYFGFGPTFVKKVIPAKSGQEPQDHLDRPSAFVQRVLTLSRDFLSSSSLWPGETRGINYPRSLCFIFSANHYDTGSGR